MVSIKFFRVVHKSRKLANAFDTEQKNVQKSEKKKIRSIDLLIFLTAKKKYSNACENEVFSSIRNFG